MTKKIFIETPADFNFQNTVNSHGWSELAPFVFDREKLTLSYIFANGGEFCEALISPADGNLEVEISAKNFDAEKIRRDVRHILRLDDDLSGFYRLVKKEKSLAWIIKINAGRLIRSPTVYEDLVKTICTTNCSWTLTKNMTANLVNKLGAETANGKYAFPTAEAMANVPADFYRTEIRAGYRAPYFAELAEKVAHGKLNPESWLDSNLPAAELKKQMKTVKGVGDYAAENLLKLVGNYEGLALDSWTRARFYSKHNRETICEDRQIREFYDKFGEWRGLALWCDLTEKWFA